MAIASPGCLCWLRARAACVCTCLRVTLEDDGERRAGRPETEAPPTITLGEIKQAQQISYRVSRVHSPQAGRAPGSGPRCGSTAKTLPGTYLTLVGPVHLKMESLKAKTWNHGIPLHPPQYNVKPKAPDLNTTKTGVCAELNGNGPESPSCLRLAMS